MFSCRKYQFPLSNLKSSALLTTIFIQSNSGVKSSWKWIDLAFFYLLRSVPIVDIWHSISMQWNRNQMKLSAVLRIWIKFAQTFRQGIASGIKSVAAFRFSCCSFEFEIEWIYFDVMKRKEMNAKRKETKLARNSVLLCRSNESFSIDATESSSSCTLSLRFLSIISIDSVNR